MSISDLIYIVIAALQMAPLRALFVYSCGAQHGSRYSGRNFEQAHYDEILESQVRLSYDETVFTLRLPIYLITAYFSYDTKSRSDLKLKKEAE